MLDRLTERRRAAQLARHYRDQEGLAIAEIARRLAALRPPSRRISTIQSARRHGRSRRATEECAAAAGRPPHHGTARATPTRIANAAIPARSCRNGPGNGFAKRCAHGEHATARRRPRMTGRARTHAGAAAKRSNDYKPKHGRTVHRHRCVRELGGGPRRRLRRRLNAGASVAVEIRTRACAWPSVNGAPTLTANASQATPARAQVSTPPRERQAAALAGHRGSGRWQAPPRLPQPRQSRPARGSRQRAAPPTTLRCPSLAICETTSTTGTPPCFALATGVSGLHSWGADAPPLLAPAS